MPQGSDKSRAKNRKTIHHSLCMQHSSDKSLQIIKKMIHKNLNIDILTTKTCLKHRGAVFNDIKRFSWQ